MPDIVKMLTIKTGKNAGQRPSVASLYRAPCRQRCLTRQYPTTRQVLPHPGRSPLHDATPTRAATAGR